MPSHPKPDAPRKPVQQQTLEREPAKTSKGLDLDASLKVVAWINETLDAAVSLLGGQSTRETALVLLILHLHRKQNGLSARKLVQWYGAWNVDALSPEVKQTVQVLQGQLLREGLIEVVTIGRKALSDVNHANFQEVLGQVLEEGLESIKRIRLTKRGLARTKEMRKVIDERIKEVKKTLESDKDRKAFDRFIEKGLPHPDPKKLPADADTLSA